MLSLRSRLFVPALMAVALGAQQDTDTVYFNARIVTMWDSHPVAEALVIRNNRILAVGSAAEVRKVASPNARRIDLHGKTVLPGLEDSHTHPIAAALSEQDRP